MSPGVTRTAQTIGTGVIAARMNVTPRQVCYWIRDGELRAIDIKRRRAKRSTYRVLLVSFEHFLRQRGLTEEQVLALTTSH